jgi:hypothetical protein
MKKPTKIIRKVRNNDPNRVKTEDELAEEEAAARLSLFDQQVQDVRVAIGHDSRVGADIGKCRGADYTPSKKWSRKAGKNRYWKP